MKKRFIIVLAVLTIFLITGCGRGGPPNEVNEPSEVRGRRIGALSGSPSAELARELGILESFHDVETMFNHLRAGAVDCVIMERLGAEEAIQGESGIRMLVDPLLEYDLRFAVAKENIQLLNVVNEAIEELTLDGVLGGLRARYFAGRTFRYVPPNVPARPGYLSLAVSPDSPPFSFIDENGEFAGFDVEVAIAVTDFLGVELRIIKTDVSDLISYVWFGRADLAVGWLQTDVSDYVNVSEPYASSAHVVIVRR